VPSDKMAALLEALASAPRLDHDAVGRIIADFAKDPGPAPIKEHRELIDRCFAGESVEAILAALTKEGSDFSLKTRDTLLAKSPTSLKITFRQLTLGGNKDFDDCMKMEYRMVNHILKRGDFFEGVRALIIDKDQQPKWNPADLAAVSAAEVDKYFAISASGDLEIY
jgi:enoyl-CoA hydratase